MQSFQPDGVILTPPTENTPQQSLLCLAGRFCALCPLSACVCCVGVIELVQALLLTSMQLAITARGLASSAVLFSA